MEVKSGEGGREAVACESMAQGEEGDGERKENRKR
jgi:hypothetical protein